MNEEETLENVVVKEGEKINKEKRKGEEKEDREKWRK